MGKILKKVISGGQTGADLAGLMAAKTQGFETGGWILKDYLTEDGPNFDLKKFGLLPLDCVHYPTRSKKNVDDSDGTVVFRLKYSPGSDFTIGYAQTQIWKKGNIDTMYGNLKNNYKPVCIITDLSDQKFVVDSILHFIVSNNIKILNVAGHRESSAPIKNFTFIVEHILTQVFEKCL